jgi:hypothetical protein
VQAIATYAVLKILGNKTLETKARKNILVVSDIAFV